MDWEQKNGQEQRSNLVKEGLRLDQAGSRVRGLDDIIVLWSSSVPDSESFAEDPENNVTLRRVSLRF
jgi:hypothetical protein